MKRIMMVGAHPDDCDFRTAGTTLKLVRQGHTVHYLSMTDGSAGHYAQKGKELVERRYQESQNSARLLGITYEILDHPDGRLMPTLEIREELIRKIRLFAPDVLITNRTNDYHADHRATAQLVQDASFLLGVPAICPDVPSLDKCPVILHWEDNFQEPAPFRADLAVPIDDVLDTYIQMKFCHESQTLEWLPWCDDGLKDFPSLPLEQRKAFIEGAQRAMRIQHGGPIYQRLAERFGRQIADGIRRAEAYQVSEYGSPLTEENRDMIED